jgi:hypothetical protein
VLIHCATVLRHCATLLSHFYSARSFYDFISHIPLVQYSAIFAATVLVHFPVLQCSIILSQCSVICDSVSHFRVARMRSGSREGTRLDCVWAHGSIDYTRRIEPSVRWSRTMHGVSCALDRFGWTIGSRWWTSNLSP